MKCYDTEGRLELNGNALNEPYLALPPASHTTFDIQVLRGQLWIMNDNCHVTLDSCAYPDTPGGGTIGTADVTAVVDAPPREAHRPTGPPTWPSRR
ncbi:hypothetical protein GCM10020220_071590 [Nonomuraea rubra]